MSDTLSPSTRGNAPLSQSNSFEIAFRAIIEANISSTSKHGNSFPKLTRMTPESRSFRLDHYLCVAESLSDWLIKNFVRQLEWKRIWMKRSRQECRCYGGLSRCAIPRKRHSTRLARTIKTREKKGWSMKLFLAAARTNCEDVNQMSRPERSQNHRQRKNVPSPWQNSIFSWSMWGE